MLVVRVEDSTRKAVLHARQTLLSVGAKLFGVVANDVSRRSSGYGYGYGDMYGNQKPVKKDQAINFYPRREDIEKLRTKIVDQTSVTLKKTRVQFDKLMALKSHK